MSEPIADAVRSILDGHLVLSRDLAEQNHYPAIDILQSISRVMIDVTQKKHQDCANQLKQILATYKKAEDLINIGAYVTGSNPKIDHAVKKIEKVNEYLRQGIDENESLESCIQTLSRLFNS